MGNTSIKIGAALFCAALLTLAAMSADAARPLRSLPLDYYTPSGDAFRDATGLPHVPDGAEGSVSVCWHGLPAGTVVALTVHQSKQRHNRTGSAFLITRADGDVGEVPMAVRFPHRIPGKRKTMVVSARVMLRAGTSLAADADAGIFLCGSTGTLPGK
jgi:hypothetical protein